MHYQLKVSFRTNGRTYAPGCILPDEALASDLAFLKRKGFVEPADMTFPLEKVPSQSSEGASHAGQKGEEGIQFPDFTGLEAEEWKSPEEVQKIRSKEELFAYAQSIGFDMGENYKEKSLKELQENVINFQEQAADEGEGKIS